MDTLLQKYNTLVSRQGEISRKDDDNDYEFHDSIQSIHMDLSEIFFGIADKNIDVARKVLLGYISRYYISKRIHTKELSSYLNRLLTYRSTKEQYYEVFCDGMLLETIKSKQKQLVFCGECTRSYLTWYGLLHESIGYAYLLNYCILHDKLDIIEKIMDLIGADMQPHLLFETLNLSSLVIRKGSVSPVIISRYIEKMPINYKLYLALKLLDRQKSPIPINACMEAIDNISIIDNYIWFVATCEIIAKRVPDHLAEAIKLVLAKYSDIFNDEAKSKWIFLSIRNMLMSLKNHKKFYLFITSNYSIVETLISKLYFESTEDYGYHIIFFSLAISNNDSVLLDRLFQALSRNPFIKDFSDTYMVLLKNRPQLSNQTIMIFRKWKIHCSSLIADELLAYYSSGDLLELFSTYLSNCMITNDNVGRIAYSIIDWCKKITTDNIENMPLFFEILANNISKRKNDYLLLLAERDDKNPNNEETTYDLAKRGTVIIPRIEYSAVAAFLSILANYDVAPICKLLQTNESANNFISSLFSKRLETQETALVFDSMNNAEKILNDSDMLEIGKIIFNNSSLNDFESLLYLFGKSHEFVELKLIILNLWVSEKVNINKINDMRMQYFLNLIPMKMLNGRPGMYGKIALGRSGIFFKTIDVIANSDINLAINAINIILSKLVDFNNISQMVFYNMSYKNYVQVMLINKSIFDATIGERDIYFKIIRLLLGEYEFDRVFTLVGRALESGSIKEPEMCNRLNRMLLLKTGFKEVDARQLIYLDNLIIRFSPSKELEKLKTKLLNLHKKIGV